LISIIGIAFGDRIIRTVNSILLLMRSLLKRIIDIQHFLDDKVCANCILGYLILKATPGTDD